MQLRILLIPPFKNEGLRVGQYLAPSIGLYRIKSFLEKHSCHEVRIYDCDLEGREGLDDVVRKGQFDIIGFSHLHPTLHNDLKLICELKRNSPGSLIVSGGQGAVFNEMLILENAPVDCIVHGLGEMTFLRICDFLGNRQGSLKDIANISYLDNGRLVRTRKECISERDFREISTTFDFDSVPYERYWEFMEKEYSDKHLRMMKNEGMLRTIRLFTSSHCPMGCSFCSSTNFFRSNSDRNGETVQKVSKISAEDIFDMMCKAREAHPGVTSFYFADDDFLIDKPRIRTLCEMIIGSGRFRNISLFCLSRIDDYSDDVLDLMHRAGFKFIIYGVESFSNKLLKDMNKKIRSDDPSALAKEVILKTIRCKIDPLINLIMFYPTTGIDDIKKTIESAIDVIESGARITVYTYIEAYSGSDILGRTIEKNGIASISERSADICGKEVRIPHIILPESPDIRSLAERSISRRDEIVECMNQKNSWNGVIPHPLYGLALFQAIYEGLGLDTTRIISNINRIIKETQEVDDQDKHGEATMDTKQNKNYKEKMDLAQYEDITGQRTGLNKLGFRTEDESRFPNIVNVCVLRGMCPCRCIHCPVGKVAIEDRKRAFGTEEMELSLFKKIVDEMKEYRNSTLRIHAVGEPIIWRNFREAIRYSKEKGITTWLFTSLCTRDRSLIQDMARNISIIEVSINSYEKEDYLRTKGIDAFDLVKENIEYLHRFISDNGLKTRVLISRVQSIDTAKDEEFVRFWKRTGLGDDVFIRSYHNYNGRIEELSENDEDNLISAKDKPVRKISPCIVHWGRFNINSDGRCAVCFNELFKKDIPEDFIIGDLKKQNIDEIWHSERLNKIRLCQLSGDYSGMQFKIPCIECKFCQPLDTKRTTSESQIRKLRGC